MKKLLLVAVVTAFAIGLIGVAYLGMTHVETAENVPAVDWLPGNAADVSYYRSYLNTAYEFDIDEDGFRRWSWLDVAEIDEPVCIARYSQFAEPHPYLDPNVTVEECERLMSERSVTISNGLYYGETHDNGGGVWVGYDREAGRAYFQSAPR